MISNILNFFFFKFTSLCKSLSNLDKLNDYENKGKISRFTKLKFTPYTKITVPFILGQSIRGLSFKENLKKDLFGNFINEILNDVDKEKLINTLFSHLNEEKHLNAASTVGLKNNYKLAKYPAWSLVMPWEKISIEKKFKDYKKKFIDNRSKHNKDMKNQDNLPNDDIFYSYDYAKSQYSQSKYLLENIKKEGLRSFDFKDSPKICILINDDEWRWCMSGEGNHRAYISSLLGDKYFECVVETIIDKKNISNFYNVKNGLYDLNEANYIFDSYFSGDKNLRGIV